MGDPTRHQNRILTEAPLSESALASSEKVLRDLIAQPQPPESRGQSVNVSLSEAESGEREIAAAKRTRSLAAKVSAMFTYPGLSARRELKFVPIENEFWFAKIYEIITIEEMRDAGRQFWAFMLTFIPVFYDLYYQALQRHLARSPGVPPHWQAHFDITAVKTDAGSLVVDLNHIKKCIESGVKAHIQGDMATALVLSYHAYKAKYPDTKLDFTHLYSDFFEHDPIVFKQVPGRFFTYLSELVLPFPSIEVGQFLFGAANERLGGLPIDLIVSWRADAWRDAQATLQR